VRSPRGAKKSRPSQDNQPTDDSSVQNATSAVRGRRSCARVAPNDPNFIEEVELDPSLDPSLLADERELEEVGAQLDDPELMVTLEGGIDDPDGVGAPKASLGDDWELDAPMVAGPDDDETGEAAGA